MFNITGVFRVKSKVAVPEASQKVRLFGIPGKESWKYSTVIVSVAKQVEVPN